MEKLVSRKEAAEMLQVTNQTISNYAKRGLLTEVKKGPRGFLFYYEHQVMALMDDVKEIADLEQKIQAYKDELLETKKQFETLKDEWKKKLHTAQRSSKIYDVAIALLHRCVDNTDLQYREKLIIKGFLNLETTSEIGEKFGVSGQRVIQVFNKSIRKLKMMCFKADMYDDVVNTNNMLIEENAKLKKTIETLNISVRIPLNDEDILFVKYPILREHISNYLSVRAYNCLSAADIYTFADLVSYQRSELMKFRSLGRKSLNEIDLLVEKHGLTFGMIEHRRTVY